MLTVWRKLHIELDTMNTVQFNSATVQFPNQSEVGSAPVTLSVQNFLDPGRFQKGIMLADSGIVHINSNESTNITVYNPTPVTLYPGIKYKIYDDDDFNSDNSLNGFDADNGENITTLFDSFNLMQENDDTDCSDKQCNVFAAAYIVPDYSWNTYNTTDISFVQNVSSTDHSLTTDQINRGLGSNSVQSDDFWIVYIQIGYQPAVSEDCDPNKNNCLGGVTPSLITNARDAMRNYEEIPQGAEGSIVFIEAMRDYDANAPGSSLKFRIQTIPHEIGHQFGLRGDNRDPVTLPVQGLMGYSSGFTFADEHLNIIRWRKKSPGISR